MHMDLLYIRNDIFAEFLEKLNGRFQKNILGNWLEAKINFYECSRITPDDSPCSTLIKYMVENGFTAGYRELTENEQLIFILNF